MKALAPERLEQLEERTAKRVVAAVSRNPPAKTTTTTLSQIRDATTQTRVFWGVATSRNGDVLVVAAPLRDGCDETKRPHESNTENTRLTLSAIIEITREATQFLKIPRELIVNLDSALLRPAASG